MIVTYVFVFLFLLMAGYMIWLNAAERKELQANVNNTKQDSTSENVIRGSIVTEDGTTLASTSVSEDGTQIRYYPYENVFAHVVGYASNGKSGLEAYANSQLLSSHISLVDQLRSEEKGEKVQGDTVVVTLDPALQQAAYYALGSYKGAVVVMEPDSGKILAMISKPDFNPNTISQDWDSMVGWATDHGVHTDWDGYGNHGEFREEDINVMHFYGVYPKK